MPSTVFQTLSRTVFQNFNADLGVNIERFYHYTSGEALKGIIKEREIWASNNSFMNDMSEIKHSMDIILNKINNSPSISSLPWISSYKHFIENQNVPEIYSVSFSKKYDDLPQWRGYGNIGNSYCLEFDRMSLYQWTQNIGVLHSVVYNQSRQNDIIDYCFIQGNTIYNHESSNPGFNQSDFIKSFHYIILLLVPLFKHEKFSSEEEIRLVLREEWLIHNSIATKTRLGKNCFIPYVAIKFYDMNNPNLQSELPIEKITIGPNVDYVLAEKGLNFFLIENNRNSISIEKTTIPYRL